MQMIDRIARYGRRLLIGGVDRELLREVFALPAVSASKPLVKTSLMPESGQLKHLHEQ